ncbi:MAG: monofunctional biosynthetic peptidoglycan transglycosylase [Alloprevotella sp.]
MFTLKIITKILKWLVVGFLAISVLSVLIYRWVPVYVTPLMLIRCGESIMDGKAPAIHHRWVPLEEMSKYMPVAVIASEDANFLSHHGFDFDAIQSAAKDLKEGKRRRGASTISQQTAKNVFLTPSSTWLRKGLEAYFTVLIELLWSKERIMEVYLNSIEMGPQIYGAEAVALRHFGCRASELTRADCALIAATLPNPLKFSSLKPSRYMRKRQKQIEHEMRFVPLLR